jgi:Ribonuclease G/E
MVMASILAHVKAFDQVAAESKITTTQGMLAPALSLAQIAEQHVQAEHIRIDHDGRLWADADIDQQIDIALNPSLTMPEGGILHISTPPGAAVIDGDSGTSRLSPDALASAMITPLARQIQLRRIAGAIVVDFPRMDHAGKDRIHQIMLAECADDPLRPMCYGWTKGGLYTLDRRHQRRPLSDILDCHIAPAKHAAIAALRQLWQSGQNKDGGNKNGLPPQLYLTKAAQDWLNGDGHAVYDAVCAGLPLPLPPEWITVQP